MENIGEKIYNLRKEKGISQEQLSLALNVTRQTVSRWETDFVKPTADNFNSLCSFFKVELNYFLTDEEITALKKETAVTTIVEESVKAVAEDAVKIEEITENKVPKFKMLKILFIVVGLVVLTLCVIICGIAVYLTAIPVEGQYIMTSESVDYVGIICLIIGIIGLAILITLVFILIKKYLNNRKSK